jgi:hypothetical protein
MRLLLDLAVLVELVLLLEVEDFLAELFLVDADFLGAAFFLLTSADFFLVDLGAELCLLAVFFLVGVADFLGATFTGAGDLGAAFLVADFLGAAGCWVDVALAAGFLASGADFLVADFALELFESPSAAAAFSAFAFALALAMARFSCFSRTASMWSATC